MEDFMDRHLQLIFPVSTENGKDQQKIPCIQKTMFVRLMVDMDVEMVWRLHYWLKAEEEVEYHSENKLTWQRRII